METNANHQWKYSILAVFMIFIATLLAIILGLKYRPLHLAKPVEYFLKLVHWLEKAVNILHPVFIPLRCLAEDVMKAKKQNITTESTLVPNGRLQDVRSSETDGEEKVIHQSRTDLNGSAPKRYTTTCYLKPKTVPAWYTESLLIYIGSTKRRFDEKIWFKHKLEPYYWSESMTTKVNAPPTIPHISEAVITRDEADGHYMSLELQQLAASAS